jgi:peptidoglycan/xylan/chitin deacetylase (PgdA/CDA1 family)
VLRFIVALSVCILASMSISASAETCSGNPEALGTSRVLTINPGEFTLLGTMQYKQTLPLKDHEVVITFDDGPLPPYTNIILDTLASQCVKATYFLVGQMAHAYPSVVRRIYNEGHTIGTHSQRHPHAFQRLSMRRVEREVDGGINSVTAALGDAKALSPFFRVPGLGRTNAIEWFLEGKQLVTWSADVDTNDWWRGSSPGAIVKRTMRRLNAQGRGIILMHDIHRATAMALPILLKELKANGYNVVHVVADGERPKSIPELIALPASDGKALPTELTNAASGDHTLATRQNQRIKKRRVSSHHPANWWFQANQVTTTKRPFWVIGGH